MDLESILSDLIDRYKPSARKDSIALTTTLDPNIISTITDEVRLNVLVLANKAKYAPTFAKMCEQCMRRVRRAGYDVLTVKDLSKTCLEDINKKSILRVDSGNPTDLPLDDLPLGTEFANIAFFDSTSIPIPPEYSQESAKQWNAYHRAHPFLFKALFEQLKHLQKDRYLLTHFYVRTAMDHIRVEEREPELRDLEVEFESAVKLINPVIKNLGCEWGGSKFMVINDTASELVIVARKKEAVTEKHVNNLMKKIASKIVEPDVMFT